MIGKWPLGTGESRNAWQPREEWAASVEQGKKGLNDAEFEKNVRLNCTEMQRIIRSRGFDFAEGIYWCNLVSLEIDDLENHEEWVTDAAVEFLETATRPYYLHFSAAPPHHPWTPFEEMDPSLTSAGLSDQYEHLKVEG